MEKHAYQIAMEMTLAYGFCPVRVTESGITVLPIQDVFDLSKKAQRKVESKIERLRKDARRAKEGMSKAFKIVGEDLSDGYHTFDELYEHRNLLFLNLCLENAEHCIWKNEDNGWIILFWNSPVGQISYHLPSKFIANVKGRIPYAFGENPWDGHTGAEVLQRLMENAE